MSVGANQLDLVGSNGSKGLGFKGLDSGEISSIKRQYVQVSSPVLLP